MMTLMSFEVREGAQLDEDGGVVLAQILTQIGDSTSFSSAQKSNGQSSTISSELLCDKEDRTLSWENWKEDILKYVKLKDRYLALASILLKSRAFHETQNGRSEAHELMPSCIVNLPRTIHNKPYIPIRSSPSPSGDEENAHPLSISHQYPFAGMVQLMMMAPLSRREQCCSEKIERLIPSPPLFVGFDIVVFDEINPKLYHSVQDFVDVFRGSFTASELAALNDRQCCPDDETQLRELYLRWAVKEAYTKALGVGMGFDFGSFEAVLDTSPDDHTSLCSWISSSSTITNSSGPLRTTGNVVQMSKSTRMDNSQMQRPQNEQWLFFFQPLYSSTHATSKLNNSHSLRGCGCVCVGPFACIEESEDVTLEVEWTDLEDLMAWHGIS